MKLYADNSARRARQIVTDVLAIVALLAVVRLGVFVHDLIAAFGAIGVQIRDAGSDFGETMTEIGTVLSGIPLIGPAVAAPFDGASAAGGTLADAGQRAHDTIATLAAVTGSLVAVFPIALILLVWLVPRLRGAARAGELAALVRSGAPLDLIALRALTRRRVGELSSIHPDPAGAWRRGDPDVIERLANLELRRTGVTLPTTRA